MVCRKCRENKSENEFYKLRSPYWRIYRKICKYCVKTQVRKNYFKKRKHYLEYSKKWRDANYERLKEQRKARRISLRDEIYQAYGGANCICCGETEKMFLQIDHINNDGAEERKKWITKVGSFYIYLKRQGFPPGYQIMCANCNLGKYLNGGICPHKTIGSE